MSEKVECPQCDGEGGYETGIICGHRCDGCKGCVGYEACKLCDGFGEVDGNCSECGPRVSEGMEMEREAAMAAGVVVIDRTTDV